MEEEHEHHTEDATWDDYNTHVQPDREDDESHWVECISDTGETYFSNVVTGETSWTNPGSELEHHDQSAISTGDGTEEFSIQKNAAAHWGVAETPVDAAASEADEVTQWLELYDPVQHVAYYFAPQSGEVRWEPPLEATALIQHCNSDAVLSTVVSLQSAARSQQARARVTAIRQQKISKHQLEDDSHIDNTNSNGGENAEVDGGIDTDAAQVSSANSQWVEVYDPSTQQQYYYSPRTSETRWDPPEAFVSSSEDRKVAAAISIQSLSRGRFARKLVHELRAHSPQSGKQQLFTLREDESEREAMCRREMNHHELLQLKGGDRFWGLDIYEREILQKQIEEEIMARTKALNRQSSSTFLQQTNVANIPLDYQGFEDVYEEEVDPERLQLEKEEEEGARMTMHYEEAQQCQNGDSFWGIQAEESRQHAANIAMAQQEAASRRFAESVLEQALSATWEAEVQQNATKEVAERGGLEQRTQARYLHWFYRQCVSVDELLRYRWPTKQQQEHLEGASSPVKRRRHPVVESVPDSVASATPYSLDDLVVRERLEHGDLRYGFRSILTVHHQGVRGTHGTHFEITQAPPECAFDEVTAAALLKSQMLVYSSDQQMNSEEGSLDDIERLDSRTRDRSQEEETTSRSSVNYRRYRMPDPHIPARFNGVPYKPNQISPTREILSGDHRKLNQLPSLNKLKPSAEVPKIRQLQKAKIKARARLKVSGASTQQISNSGSNSSSARGREADEDTDTTDGDPRTQFRRQEHEVLSKLFALMDVDGSGTVNQDEMRWALQRDEEIHALAKTSPLLRLLLKQRTHLEALFSSQAVEGLSDSDTSRSESSRELSWAEFLARCEYSYLRLMSEGLIQPDVVASTTRSREVHTKGASNFKNNYHELHPELSAREAEAQTIRRVFALLDSDRNGVIDVAEVQQALYNSAATTPKSDSRPGTASKELRALVEGSRALQPMLHQELFMTAFTKFEPLDPRGISEEEFVAFCLEIAHVAAANNMVASVG